MNTLTWQTLTVMAFLLLFVQSLVTFFVLRLNRKLLSVINKKKDELETSTDLYKRTEEALQQTRDACREKDKIISQLRIDIRERDESISTLNESIKDYDSALTAQASTIESLKSTIKQRDEKIEEKNKKIENLADTPKEAELRAIVFDRDELIKETMQENDKLEDQVNSLENQVKELEDQLASEKQEHDRVTDEWSAALVAAKERITRLEDERSALEETVRLWKKRYDTEKLGTGTYVSEGSRKPSNASDSQDDSKHLRDRLNALESELGASKRAYETLQAERDRLKTRLKVQGAVFDKFNQMRAAFNTALDKLATFDPDSEETEDLLQHPHQINPTQFPPLRDVL